MSVVLLLLLGCGAEDPCQGRRDLATSPAGLDLTAAEHPTGWGHPDCFFCHQRWDIHTDDCIDGVAVDSAGLDVRTVAECVACHGWNGVDAWRDLDRDER